MRISVLLADNHVVVRRGLRAWLEAEPGIVVVGEAAGGLEALAMTQALDPDVLVLDLVMPDMPGLEVMKHLHGIDARTRIVVFSMHAGDAHVVSAFNAGAVGYVVKDAGASEMVRAIHDAAEGRRFLSARLSKELLEAHGSPVAPSSDPYDTLTAREREVLTLAARGLTNREIGKELTISRRTTETHRANLLRKLGLKGQKDLIRFALRRGLIEM
jgi:two-component system response regulator NreC